jgi:hypothetical protein
MKIASQQKKWRGKKRRGIAREPRTGSADGGPNVRPEDASQ